MKINFNILIFALMAWSCNSNDDGQQSSGKKLDGTWSLVNVSGGFAGVNDDFETGLIIWGFDTTNFEITVTNNNTETVIFDGLPSGTYDYQILTTTGEAAYLVVDSFSYEIAAPSTSVLILDEDITSDGFRLTLNR